MEAWRDELYHGYFTNIGNKVGNAVKSTASKVGNTINRIGVRKTNSDGTWKQHKYIRKEGTRYIYPEDVKRQAEAAAKKASNAVKKTSNIVKNTGKSLKKSYEEKKDRWGHTIVDTKASKNPKRLDSHWQHWNLDKLNRDTTSGFYAPFDERVYHPKRVFKNDPDKIIKEHPYSYSELVKYNGKDERKTKELEYKSKYAKKIIKDLDKLFNEYASGSSSVYYDNGHDFNGNTYRLQTTKQYKNGKQWLDSLTVSEYWLDEQIPNTFINETVYTYNYGYLHQAVNKAGSSLNKLYNNGKKLVEEARRVIDETPLAMRQITRSVRNKRIETLNKKLKENKEHNTDIRNFLDKHLLDISSVYSFDVPENYETSRSGYTYIEKKK